MLLRVVITSGPWGRGPGVQNRGAEDVEGEGRDGVDHPGHPGVDLHHRDPPLARAAHSAESSRGPDQAA